MSLFLVILLFLLGVGLVVFSSEKLVEGVVGVSAWFGISAFLISIIFVGFDTENLAIGTTAIYESVAGIALGPSLEQQWWPWDWH